MNKLIVLFLITLLQNFGTLNGIQVYDAEKLEKEVITSPAYPHFVLERNNKLKIKKGEEFYLRFTIKPSYANLGAKLLSYETYINPKYLRYIHIEPSKIQKFVSKERGIIKKVLFYQYFKLKALETAERGVTIAFYRKKENSKLIEEIDVKFYIS